MIILIVGCVLITFMRRKTTKNKRFKGKKNKQIKINLDPHKGETSGRRCCEKRALEISALLV